MGLMGTFYGPKSLAVQNFFNALWAGLTNPRDISDSFNENPLIFAQSMGARKTLSVNHFTSAKSL